MISPEFERLIKQSFPKSFTLSMQERFPDEITEHSEVDAELNPLMQQAIVLTISGHLFRLMIAIVFTRESALDNCIRKALKKSGTELDEASFYDYLNEVGNVLCGSIKRDLQKAVPSLGMSTPNLLNIESFKFVESLKIDYTGSYLISSEKRPLFYVNYYLGAYGLLECSQDINEEEEVDSGELELF